MSQPIATWNPILGVWEKPSSSPAWELFLETWPTSGTTRNGKLYPRPTLVPRTDANAFSLLPTPVASDARRRRPTDADADRHQSAIAHWARLTRPAPPAVDTGQYGGFRQTVPFTEWMMGWPEGHVADAPGLTRPDQLAIIGNGVVPRQALAALIAMEVAL